MANISVTYTFSNGTVADATEVNQNFTDVINGLSDGTKDISVAAITAAGTATFNGAVNLGNATGDDITVTGLLASSLSPKTDATYSLGTSSLGYLGIYLGRNSNRLYLQNNSSASASWTYTWPATAGTAGQILVNQGSGTQAWEYNCTDTSAKSADYTVTTSDMIRTVLMTTAGTNRTVTLPAASSSTDRILTVKKVDSGTGTVTVARAGSDTIDGQTSTVLNNQYSSVTIQSDGTNWHIIDSMYVGEIFGATTRSGTGGSTKSTTLSGSGAWSSGSVNEIGSITLNKGVYLICANPSIAIDTAGRSLDLQLFVGGTNITPNFYYSTIISGGEHADNQLVLPITITSDSTAISLRARLTGGAAGATVYGEMSIVRLAP